MLLFQTSTGIFDIKLFDNVAKHTLSLSAKISGEVENILLLTNGYENSD